VRSSTTNYGDSPRPTEFVTTPAQWLADGQAAEKAGDLALAEALYRRVLNDHPAEIGTLSRLGQLLTRQLRYAEAEVAFGVAAHAAPQHPGAQYNHGRSLAILNRHGDAIRRFERTVQLAPDAAAAYLAWAQSAEALHSNCHEALAIFARAQKALKEANATVTVAHAQCLERDGQLIQAAERYEQIVSSDPEIAWVAAFNAGVVWDRCGERSRAVQAYDRALSGRPTDARTWINRGISLLALERTSEAIDSHRQALVQRPDLQLAHRALGIALLADGQVHPAIEALSRALKDDESDVEAWVTLGDAYLLLRSGRAALGAYDAGLRALALGAPPGTTSRGVFLSKQLDVQFLMQDYARARLTAQTLVDEEPDRQDAPGLLLHALAWTADWAALPAAQARIRDCVERGEYCTQPFPLLAATDSAALQRQAADLFFERHLRLVTPMPSPERSAHRRIRIAYVSPDFREHPVGALVAATIEAHDRSQFEVFGFSTYPNPDDSPLSLRFRRIFEHFEDVHLKTDRQIAERIREREIDLLVDLVGHTAGARPEIPALRPASLNVSFLGYPCTYGGRVMDYLIADPVVIPPSLECHYGEAVVRLPESLVAPGDERRITETTDRAAHGLPADATVLVAFHNTYKVTPELFAVWMRLLSDAPETVLWLSRQSDTAVTALRAEAERAGVDPGRLYFAGRVADSAAHLARLALGDLFLDAYPYNAHSSAADALWAGLPVVTYPGESFASRVCAGLLSAVGVPELVCESLDAYASLASHLVQSHSDRQQMQARIREGVHASAAFDPIRYTRGLEAAYLEMARRLSASEPTRAIDVTRAPDGTCSAT